jgi:hypothetical protein
MAQGTTTVITDPQRSTPNSLHDQRRRRDQHGLTTPVPPRISGSSNRIAPRAWVSITSSSLVLAGATGTNLARACSVNGPNRDTSVKLLTGSYSVASMLPSTRRPRSVRTSRAVVPTPIGPGEALVMEVTAGSHVGWFWKCSVATNRNTSAGGAR